MKIIYVGDSKSIHDFRFIRKLVESGYDTNVLTIDKNPVKIEGAKYFTFPQKLNEANNRFVNDVKYVKYIYDQRKYIRKIIKEIEPDILHGGWIPAHGFISALSGFHPFLLMPWGSDVLVIPQNASYLTKKQIIWTIKKSDMIQCDAEHVKNEIIRLSGYPENKIIVFPQGIDLKKFTPKVNGSKIRNKLRWQDNKILIMTRSFKPVYGVEYFLRAIPNIIKENPETRIILCGNGPLEDSFKSFIIKNKLADYVYFAGFVKNEELPLFYAASEIYISSSLSDGTSTSLLEAMACGLPVVVTDLPAIKEWIRDGYNGFLVPKKNSHQVYKKLNLLLNDDDLREKFGRRNLEITKNRADWDKNFEKLECMYNELIS